MKKIILITGANRGLGKAIIDLALKDDDSVIISLSRSINEEHKGISTNKLIFIKVDLSEPFSAELINKIGNYISLDSTLYFFNNASIILPIDKIGGFNQPDIETSIKVNIQYPVNLINFILNNFRDNKIVLVNISSGAGVNPVPYWSLYGGSKAYMNMFFKVLGEENKNNENVILYSIDPGVLNTGMQESIRKNEAPKQDYFKSLKDENRLIESEVAAMKIFKEINY